MVAVWIKVVLVATWVVAALTAAQFARGSTEGSDVRDVILELHPEIDSDWADRLAPIIEDAALDHDLDPALLTVLVYRESSFSPEIARLERFGQLGERGLLQVHGAALSYRPEDCSRELATPRCQVQTGARYLAEARRICGGSTWRWVAAYGMSRCPSEDQARDDWSTARARDLYVEVGGESW